MSSSKFLSVVLLCVFCAGSNAQNCSEADAEVCPALASCVLEAGVPECICPPGTVAARETLSPSLAQSLGREVHTQGDCLTQSYTVRMVMTFDTVPSDAVLIEMYAKAVDPVNWLQLSRTVVLVSDGLLGPNTVTLNVLFEYKNDAKSAVTTLRARTASEWGTDFGGVTVTVDWRANLYRYTTGTTSDYRAIAPSGLEVLSTSFDYTCGFAGCWLVDILYTTGGPESLNVLYLPRAQQHPAADPADLDAPEGTVLSTFAGNPDTTNAANYPCGSLVVTGADVGGTLAREETACCLADFFEEYRANAWLADFMERFDINKTNECPTFGTTDFVGADWMPSGDLVIGAGKFDGLPDSEIVHTGVRDITLNQYTAQLRLDERELRRYASVRQGTIGAQYVLDFYVGLLECKPTDTEFLDCIQRQVPIHVEKSDFFVVSTFGVVGTPEERLCCGESNGTGCEIDLNGNAYCPPERWNITCMDWVVTDTEGFTPYWTYCCTTGYSAAEQEQNCGGVVQNCIDFYDDKGRLYTVPRFYENGTLDRSFEWNVTIIGPKAEFGEGTCCVVDPETGLWNNEDCYNEVCIDPTTGEPSDECSVPCRSVFKARDMDPAVYRPVLPDWAFPNPGDEGWDSDDPDYRNALIPLPNGTLFRNPFVHPLAVEQTQWEDGASWLDWVKCCLTTLHTLDFAGTKFEVCAACDFARGCVDPNLNPPECAKYKKAVGLFPPEPATYQRKPGTSVADIDDDRDYNYLVCFNCPYEEACRCSNDCGCEDDPSACNGLVNDVNLRLHEILDPAGDGTRNSANKLQFVQVTFNVGAGYEAFSPLTPGGTGGAVLLSSVKVGQDTFYNSADLLQACASSDGDQVWTTELWAEFESRLSGDTCAPQVQICQNSPDLEDRFVTFNVPLPTDTFDQFASGEFSGGESDLSATKSIFVEFLVKLKAIGGTEPLHKLVKAQIPVVLGGVNTWCAADAAAVGLEDMANVDIMIGSAMNATELDRLRIRTDIASTELDSISSVELDSASIESGLLTFVLKGNSSFFEQPRTGRFKLEIEDIISLHLMENGDATAFSEILAMATGGTAFTVSADRWGHHAYLDPTDELLRRCSFFPTRPTAGDLFPEVCVARRDMRAREPVQTVGLGGTGTTAHEITTSLAGCGEFMQNIFFDTDYAFRLGEAFGQSIVDKWGVNDRYVRAFWVNPGYEWTPSTVVGDLSRFTISQKIIVFVLINLNEDFMRRRMILQTENPRAAQNGLGQAAVTAPISQKDLLAQVLEGDGVSASDIVELKITMALSDQEACFSTKNVRDVLKGRLERGLEQSTVPSNGFKQVQLTGILVDKATVRCDTRRRDEQSRRSLGAATATVNAMVVVDPAKEAQINLKELQGTEGITSLALGTGESCSFCADVPVPVAETPAAQAPLGVTPSATDSDDEDEGSNMTMIIAAVCGGVGGILVVVAGFMAWRMTKKETPQESNVNVVEAVSLADLKSQLAAEA